MNSKSLATGPIGWSLLALLAVGLFATIPALGQGSASATVLTPDDVVLDFEPGRLLILNVILGLILFGIALDLKVDDFRRVLTSGRPALVGIVAQMLLLPAFTYLMVLWLEPWPSVALGMILVSSCPGGNTSNYMTHLARGNTALSVSLSAVSIGVAVVVTPLNLAFWGSLHPSTASLLRQVDLDPLKMATTVMMVLGLPVVLGMTLAARKPELARRIRRPLSIASLVIFTAFVVVAVLANVGPLAEHLGKVAGLVTLHNAVALVIGYYAAKAVGLFEADRRAVSIEVGMQNTALGLVLIFDFFEGLGGMVLVTAWWGVWHLIAGLGLAAFWSKRPV